MIAALALAAPVQAHAPAKAKVPEGVPGPSIAETVGPNARLLDKDTYAVPFSDGTVLHTHGPDPGPAQKPGPAPGAELSSTANEDVEPYCANVSAQHVLYGYPAGAADRRAAGGARNIRLIMRKITRLVSRESESSGGPEARMRVVCNQAGNMHIGTFEGLPASECTQIHSFECIAEGAKQAGYSHFRRNYTIFWDGGGGGGGVASHWHDARPSTDNWNHFRSREEGSTRGAGYAISHRWDGSESDPPDWHEVTVLHEIGHNMGATQYWAPYSSGAGHCWLELSVMCYDDGGELIPATGTVQQCINYRFDCRFNTYFNAAPAEGDWLSSNWNLGSCRNAWIEFAGGCDERDFRRLADGESHLGPSGPFWNEWTYYVTTAGSGKRALRTALRLPSGTVANLHLYVRHGGRPTTTQYDCRATQGGDVDKECTNRDPAAGAWWIGVRVQGIEDWHARNTRHRVRAVQVD